MCINAYFMLTNSTLQPEKANSASPAYEILNFDSSDRFGLIFVSCVSL